MNGILPILLEWKIYTPHPLYFSTLDGKCSPLVPCCSVAGYLVTTVLPSLITTRLAFFSSFLVWKAGLLSRLLSCTKAEDRETPLLRFLCCMSVTPVCGRLLRMGRNCEFPNSESVPAGGDPASLQEVLRRKSRQQSLISPRLPGHSSSLGPDLHLWADVRAPPTMKAPISQYISTVKLTPLT